jgi:hypothetical protein
MIIDPVFLIVGCLRVARTKHITEMVVAVRLLSLVQDQEANRRAQCLALEDPGEDLHLVALFPGCGQLTLARLPAVQVLLDRWFVEGEPGWASVHDNADCPSVGLTPGGYPEGLAKGISCHFALNPGKEARGLLLTCQSG